MTDLHELKFPIGEFERNPEPSSEVLAKWIETIEGFPNSLDTLLKEVGKEQLYWRYRPEGWNIMQVVHHCADSHMNALARIKLALTENKPKIRPYEEAKWVLLADASQEDLADSLQLIKAVHAKWTKVLKSLNENELCRLFVHPDYEGVFNVYEHIGNYAWHCKHHLAHIRNALKFKGKFDA